MLVRPRDFEVSAGDPFASDTLGRQEHVKAVCRAIAEMGRARLWLLSTAVGGRARRRSWL